MAIIRICDTCKKKVDILKTLNYPFFILADTFEESVKEICEKCYDIYMEELAKQSEKTLKRIRLEYKQKTRK